MLMDKLKRDQTSSLSCKLTISLGLDCWSWMIGGHERNHWKQGSFEMIHKWWASHDLWQCKVVPEVTHPHVPGTLQIWAGREVWQHATGRVAQHSAQTLLTLYAHLLCTTGAVAMQGILGSTPWNALVFLTLYMQLLGMSDTAAAAMMALFLGGTALGGLLGGFVGDAAARRFPSHGRILVCQFSVVSGVPLSLLLLKVSMPTSTPRLHHPSVMRRLRQALCLLLSGQVASPGSAHCVCSAILRG